MKLEFLLISIFIFITSVSNAQTYILCDSVKVNATDIFTIDQKGDLFLTDVKGNIFQYSKNLEQIRSYSPPKPFTIQQLDVWQGLRIFCFYRDLQEFALLDRFLTNTENYTFDLSASSFISEATLAYDNNLWLLDQPMMKLIKYNVLQRRVEFEIPLNNVIPVSLLHINSFKEYQNRIFIIDGQQGIFVFDNLGNYLGFRKLNLTGEIGFYATFLYYLENENIVTRDLYSDEVRKLHLPQDRKVDKVILFNTWMYILEGNMIYKYEVN